MDQHSYIGNMSPAAMEGLYRQFLDNPSSVDASWQQFFSGFEFARLQYGENGGASGAIPEEVDKEFKVINLINNGYRAQGHLFTKTNPVRERRKYTPDLSIENFGLNTSELDTVDRKSVV